MKKIALLALFIGCVAFANAQINQTVPVDTKGKSVFTKKIDPKTLKHSDTKGTTRWYNYGETKDSINGRQGMLYGNYLFPDTTVLVDYGGTFSGPWIHALGDVLDVKSMDFNDDFFYPTDLHLGSTSTYKIDSIGMYIIYERHMVDPLIVDTMIVEVAVNNTTTQLQTYYFPDPTLCSNLGVDTVYFKGVPYNYSQNALALTGKKTFKFPLDEQFYADSTENGLHYLQFETSTIPTVTANKFVVTSAKFKPGYTWTANTDYLADLNAVRFISYKEVDGSFPIYNKYDFNVSYIIPDDILYNTNTNGWAGLYIPSFAYMGTNSDYLYEHHLIYYLVNCQTGCDVSVSDVAMTKSYTLGDAYPNPAGTSAEIVIPYTLNNKVNDNVFLSIYSTIGQRISRQELKASIQGENHFDLNTHNMNPGVYFYSLETTEGRITKSFVIER